MAARGISHAENASRTFTGSGKRLSWFSNGRQVSARNRAVLEIIRTPREICERQKQSALPGLERLQQKNQNH